MNATHYIETFRQNDNNKIVSGPMQKIDKLPDSLSITKKSNCRTIAVFKIKFKDHVKEPFTETYKTIE